MQTILLTGAAGTVGLETLKLLTGYSDLYHIKVFEIKTKRTQKRLFPYKKMTDIIWGDLTDKESVYHAVKGCDIVIHTAAMIPPEADAKPELAEKVNTGGTMHLVDAINALNKEIFLIYTSSISVYGDRVENPEITVFDEIKPSPRDYYALTKIKAEEYIKHHALNFTIFRLSAVFSPSMKPDPLMFHMPLNTGLEIVTAKDVARALVAAPEKKLYLNDRVFNLGGGKSCRVSYEDFLNRNFKIFGLQKLDFPPNAFAEKNFHCGIYKDSHVLNKILHFQTDSLEDHFRCVRTRTNFFSRACTWILRHLIKKNMLKKSEPFKAVSERNMDLLHYFFNHKTRENVLQ
jgi:nucleoside-diphosphate-sugar epimerase